MKAKEEDPTGNSTILDDNDFIEGVRQKIQVYLLESSRASTPNARWDYLKYRMRQFSKKFQMTRPKRERPEDLS